jgi:hypothetical protein
MLTDTRTSVLYFPNPAPSGAITFDLSAINGTQLTSGYFIYELAGVNLSTPAVTGTGNMFTTTFPNQFVINFLGANNNTGADATPAAGSILTKSGVGNGNGQFGGGAVVAGFADGTATGSVGAKSVAWANFGGLAAGQVSIGLNAPPPPSGLTLIVNKTNGQAKIKNTSAAPVTMDYYSITSPGAALDTAGWNSLADQNYDAGLPADFTGNGVVDNLDLTTWKGAVGPSAAGDANGDGRTDGRDFLLWQRQLGQTPSSADKWAEAGGSTSSVLIELFLNGATVLDPNEEVSLGAAYNEAIFGAADGDLNFTSSNGESDTIFSGSVSYVTSFATAVPEPASAVMALVAGCLLRGRRRRTS